MTVALLIFGATAVAGGSWLCVNAFATSTPPLSRTINHLHRPPRIVGHDLDGWSKLGAKSLAALGPRLQGEVTRRRLDLAGRTPEAHAATLVVAALLGLLLPVVVGTLLMWTSATAATWIASLGVGFACAALGVLLVTADLEQRANAASRDLRHQLSAYLDVLTMLLASNQGNEGALRAAADAGDGRLFIDLRRRMLEAATAGRPAVTALAALGRDLGLVELVEIAASASLATSQGAPVARSLAAKTDSLRAALQAEQEQDARVRTGKITFPLVAMGVVFIIAGLYPALVSIRSN